MDKPSPTTRKLARRLLAAEAASSVHSLDMHEYNITLRGIEIGEPMWGYRVLTSGIPEPWSAESGQEHLKLREDRPSKSARNEEEAMNDDTSPTRKRRECIDICNSALPGRQGGLALAEGSAP